MSGPPHRVCTVDEDDELEPWEADDDLDDVGPEGADPYDPDGDVELGVVPQTGAGLFDAPVAPTGVSESAAASPTSSVGGSSAADDAPTPDRSEPAVALALYRRYRPDTFAQVVGQEHVTQPLQRALANNRVNHAYLFSGPRGCGKTTSARILARALNCENGPAAEPCGHCQSCRDLATGGPGSIDVIEIDAASHGGVDDARDLRERAFFAPVASRYKIYIIDEAHMVTTQGFNALLKLVEEPPPHVKFIFATTEPDKVIGTIRSRTHHYPFRLVPPKVLTHYLAEICEKEGISVESGVLPLVVRAGGGSVRDSLSVLDQLLGGASDRGVTYEHATGLLGYTPESLLDEMVEAFAAGEGAGVFSVVDKVIEAGQDPRRFAEDLLGRLRDLVIVAAVPDALSSGLVDVSPEQGETYVAESKAMGLGELTRAADVIAEGLTQMRGTTAPRLHLELMCARVLLPGADVAERGINARLDRIERRLNLGGLDTGVPMGDLPRAAGASSAQVDAVRPPAPAAPAPGTTPAPSAGPEATAPAPPRSAAAPDTESRPRGRRSAPTSAGGDAPSGPAAATPGAPTPGPARPVRPERPPRPERTRPAPAAAAEPAAAPRPEGPAVESPAAETPRQAAPSGSGARGLTTQDARDRWGDLLEAVGARRRFTKVLLEGNAAVVSLVNNVLTIALSSPGARASFERPREREVFLEAVAQVFGAVLQVETLIDPEAARQQHTRRGGQQQPAHQQQPAQRPAPTGPGRAAEPLHPQRARPTTPRSEAPRPEAQRSAAPQPEANRHAPRGPREGRPTTPPSADGDAAHHAGSHHAGPHRDVPPPLEPPDDPWDEPPPEDDPYGDPYGPQPVGPGTTGPARTVAPVRPAEQAVTPAPSVTASAVPEPAAPTARTPRPAPAVAPEPRPSPEPRRASESRPSRYSQVAAAPPPPREPTPEEEAAAYANDDVTVGEGYESAAELLTNVLGAELLLEEQQETGMGS
ncbi:DNA polymerase III subunit gamma and tau [Raineyella sp. W15-4]|uniref:DNA polymerase III subunit gamma and tau n=1 Tax=Raineyella sp. W15-4 TaxID=3081651 RepID=UPI00398934BA